MSPIDIEQQVLSLPESERIRLIDVLWNSLLTDADRDRMHRWIAESERRLDAIDAGKMKTYDADEVFRELRNRPKR